MAAYYPQYQLHSPYYNTYGLPGSTPYIRPTALHPQPQPQRYPIHVHNTPMGATPKGDSAKLKHLRKEVKKAEAEYKESLAEAEAAEAMGRAQARASPYVYPTAMPTYGYTTPYTYPYTLPGATATPMMTPGMMPTMMATPGAHTVVLDHPHNMNLFVNSSGAPAAAAPCYTGLSPIPPSYEELGAASEISLDKWANPSAGYLYDNRESPVGLNSVHSALEVHPVLAHGETPLIMDLCRRKEDVSTLESPASRWWEDEEGEGGVRKQPATLPRVTKLRLVSPKLKDAVEVVNPMGVTVGNVIDKTLQYFHHQLDPVHDAASSYIENQRRATAYAANAQHQPYGRVHPYLRRVDLLYGEPVFDGLSADPDLMMERYGQRDCAMLRMHFKARDAAWWSVDPPPPATAAPVTSAHATATPAIPIYQYQYSYPYPYSASPPTVMVIPPTPAAPVVVPPSAAVAEPSWSDSDDELGIIRPSPGLSAPAPAYHHAHVDKKNKNKKNQQKRIENIYDPDHDYPYKSNPHPHSHAHSHSHPPCGGPGKCKDACCEDDDDDDDDYHVDYDVYKGDEEYSRADKIKWGLKRLLWKCGRR